ncbi:hypothetical protein ASE36_19425 [Rhizobium sp. Root274]|uniref:hypothetical protein n=1 Tax=unclassified Rhizobium TaxID=2613769 RepID=UPI0007143A9F|nr:MULTISPECIES: hypothetical protein [unclassified Rhizobium]KRD27979.1 hypothetical protein ASE36_19425 [Rhizobium sp. Root274]
MFFILALSVGLYVLAHTDVAPSPPSKPQIPSMEMAWIIEGMIVDYELKAEPPINMLTFTPFRAGRAFTYSPDGFVVDQVVANHSSIFILLNNQTGENHAGEGHSRVDVCDYSGNCRPERTFANSIFRISASEQGYYAVTYDPRDLFRGDAGTFPRKSELQQISGGRAYRICCSADLGVLSMSNDSHDGLTIVAVDFSLPFERRSATLYRVDTKGKLSKLSSSISYVGCEYHQFRRRFYCIGQGGGDDGKGYRTTWSVTEVMDGEFVSPSWKSSAFPSISDAGLLLIRLDDGTLAEILAEKAIEQVGAAPSCAMYGLPLKSACRTVP